MKLRNQCNYNLRNRTDRVYRCVGNNIKYSNGIGNKTRKRTSYAKRDVRIMNAIKEQYVKNEDSSDDSLDDSSESSVSSDISYVSSISGYESDHYIPSSPVYSEDSEDDVSDANDADAEFKNWRAIYALHMNTPQTRHLPSY